MSTQTLPLWGQAWELTIYSRTDTDAVDTLVVRSDSYAEEALRVTFDVLQAMNSLMWYADISVYNLDTRDQQNLLAKATWVTLKAGFMSGPNIFSTIWSGPVFQTIWTRENVVDQKLTFHCVANPLFMNEIVSFSVGPYADQVKLLQRMCGEVGAPTLSTASANPTLGSVAAQRMTATQYPRGNTVFGSLPKYFNQIADSNFMQSWNDGSQMYISEITTGKVAPDYVYAPPLPPDSSVPVDLPAGTVHSLIGTPQQIQQGVTFTVLLDPRLKVGLPPQLVRLVQTVINSLSRTPMEGGEAVTILTPDLLFYVAQLRHSGDTRGNVWQTEVTGFSTNYADKLLDLFNM